MGIKMRKTKKSDGDGINSIHEIARIARVSPATVSRVINNQANVKQKTRMRINEIIRESNYSPRVVKRRTLTIGVLIEEAKFVFGNYVSEIMEGAFEYAARYITPAVAAFAYGIEAERIRVIQYPPSTSIKVVITRSAPAGSVLDKDLYGAQQHMPLMRLAIPDYREPS